MISAVAEATSNSALRVLENRFLSYRCNMSDALSAIGMVVLAHDRHWLYPLTLPTGRIVAGRCEIKENWSGVFSMPRLKVYLSWEPGCAWSKLQPTFVWASRWIRQQCYALQLQERGFSNQRHFPPGTRFSCDDFVRRPSNSAKLFIGQRPLQEIMPIAVSELSPEKKAEGTYRQGVLRVFCHDLRTDIPHNRKYELFIPFARRDMTRIEQFAACSQNQVMDFTVPDYSATPLLQWFLEIPEDVVARFHALADERSLQKGHEELSPEEQLPYQPVGTPRNEGDCESLEGDHCFRLKTGDLVYFDVANTGGTPSVTEVSLSSIWRGAVKERSHAFFYRINSELLPFNASRQYISPAEWLFGFVEMNEDKDQIVQLARTFAGKMHFSPARLVTAPQDGPLDDAVTLKVLNTPKLPCPAMYFAAPDGTPKKSELAAGTHNPNGRKFYLHTWQENGEVVKLNKKGLRDANGKEPWRSHNSPNGPRPHLKVRITPLKKGCVFYFHVDFDNLSAAELDLLCFALQPDGLFHHKIGMGKPIGLGTVRVSIEGLFLVNRLARYDSDDMFGGYRYHQVWWGDQHGAEWRNRYPGAAAAGRPTIGAQDQPEHRAARYLEQHSDSATRALLILGNPQNVRYPVHYPQRANEDVEVETFRWFVHNEPRATHPKQRLHWNGTGLLPTLER